MRCAPRFSAEISGNARNAPTAGHGPRGVTLAAMMSAVYDDDEPRPGHPATKRRAAPALAARRRLVVSRSGSLFSPDDDTDSGPGSPLPGEPEPGCYELTPPRSVTLEPDAEASAAMLRPMDQIEADRSVDELSPEPGCVERQVAIELGSPPEVGHGESCNNGLVESWPDFEEDELDLPPPPPATALAAADAAATAEAIVMSSSDDALAALLSRCAALAGDSNAAPGESAEPASGPASAPAPEPSEAAYASPKAASQLPAPSPPSPSRICRRRRAMRRARAARRVRKASNATGLRLARGAPSDADWEYDNIRKDGRLLEGPANIGFTAEVSDDGSDHPDELDSARATCAKSNRTPPRQTESLAQKVSDDLRGAASDRCSEKPGAKRAEIAEIFVYSADQHTWVLERCLTML